MNSKNTKPELKVQSILKNKKLFFVKHIKALAGTPDIVIPSHKIIIDIKGCFWHQHEDCKYACLPKTKADFWKKKLEGNKQRDKLKQSQLNKLGWKIINIWECEIKDKKDHLCSKLKDISQ